MPRNYKEEYKKFQSSPCAIKKRVKLNKINRDKGTYGNGDGKDNSHVKNGDGTVVIVLKSASDNRGSKNDMPGDKRARGIVAKNGAMVYRDNPNAPKAAAGLSFSRGPEYHGGGPYYGQSAGAAALTGALYGSGSAFDDDDGLGSGGGTDRVKKAKIKEKSGTTVNERRALRKAKKAVRKAKKVNSGDPRDFKHEENAKAELASLQSKIQQGTFTAEDNIKPWWKSSKGWEKDKFNRQNSAQKQQAKWEKNNPEKDWEDSGGGEEVKYWQGNRSGGSFVRYGASPGQYQSYKDPYIP